MTRKQGGWWVAGLTTLMMAGTPGCADETPKATDSAAPEQAAVSAAPADTATGAAPAGGKVVEKAVENPGATLPKGKVEQSATSPDGQVKLVFLDEGEHGDWFWRSLYLTSGDRHMDLGNYTEIANIQWSAGGDELTAEVKAGTDFNKLTTYRLHYRLGAERYQLEELKVETVESAG